MLILCRFCQNREEKQSAFSEMVGTNIPEFTQDPFVSVMLNSSSAPPVWCGFCTALPYPGTPSDKWKSSPDGSQLCEGLKPLVQHCLLWKKHSPCFIHSQEDAKSH